MQETTIDRSIVPVPTSRDVMTEILRAGAQKMLAVVPCPQTPPTPLLGALDRLRGQRLALHIPAHRVEVLVFLDRETLETPLDDSRPITKRLTFAERAETGSFATRASNLG